MANIKLSSNQFIGTKELQKMKEFLDDEGFRKLLLEDAITFGITKNSADGADWTNGLVQQGTNVGTIKHAELFAIDDTGRFVRKVATDNIAITDDSQWYWVKVSYAYRNYETYQVDIDASGNLSCPNSDGNFTSILRGQPNVASRVKFEGASLNTSEYDVQSVTDDNNAILQGSFQAEVGVNLIVVGTFTPDSNPSAGDKDILNYDGATLTLVQSVNEPAHTSGQEFFLARVQRTGGNITIEDKRSNYVFRSKPDHLRLNVDTDPNVLIGIESAKYDTAFATKDSNIVQIGWGLRSSSFTSDPSTKKVTINAGEGGIFKSTTDFTNGDFNGWRMYANGKQHMIVNSTKTGSQIDLIIDSYDQDDITAATEITIVPNADSISVRARNNSSNSNNKVETIREFPIASGVGVMKLIVYANPAPYYFEYSYNQNRQKTTWNVFPADNVSGFLVESSFDSNGQLSVASRQTYDFSSNLPEFTESGNSYNSIIGRVDLGDIPGVNYRSLSNGSPITPINSGTDKVVQVWTGSLTLAANQFISLETSTAVEGNEFYLKFENDAALSGQTWKLVQDYVSPASPGILLLDFGSPTAFWRDRAAENNVLIKCVFDGTNWLIYPDSSVTQAVLDIVTSGSVLLTGSTSTGVQKYDATPTGKAGWDNRSIPDRQYVDDQIAALDGGAPAALNTLNELAAAIGDDPNFSSTVLPLAGGTMTGDINMGNAQRVVSLLDPALAQDAATKAYVDSLIGSGGGNVLFTDIEDMVARTFLANDEFIDGPPKVLTRGKFLSLLEYGYESVTIAAGVVTLLGTNTYVAIDTEAAASIDEVDTINREVDQDSPFLIIKRTTIGTRTVVIKHGTGNIQLNSGIDMWLDEDWHTLTLKYDISISAWTEVSRSGGSNGWIALAESAFSADWNGSTAYPIQYNVDAFNRVRWRGQLVGASTGTIDTPGLVIVPAGNLPSITCYAADLSGVGISRFYFPILSVETFQKNFSITFSASTTTPGTNGGITIFPTNGESYPSYNDVINLDGIQYDNYRNAWTPKP